jgi:hypothetical protein
MRRPPSLKTVEGKRHEVFKSRLQSRHWPCRLSAQLVEQPALLLNAMPRCLRSCPAKTVTTTALPRELLRMAFHATESIMNNGRKVLSKTTIALSAALVLSATLPGSATSKHRRIAHIHSTIL